MSTMLLVIFKINIFKGPIAQCELLQKTPPADQTTSYNVTMECTISSYEHYQAFLPSTKEELKYFQNNLKAIIYLVHHPYIPVALTL